MRVKLASAGAYDHERMIRGLSRTLHCRADQVAAEFIEMGAVLMTAITLGKLDRLAVDLELMRARGELRELEPLLAELRLALEAGMRSG